MTRTLQYEESFADAVLRGLRKLPVFSGRDTRAEYWPFAASVVLLGLFVASVVPVFSAFIAFDRATGGFDETIGVIAEISGRALALRLWVVIVLVAVLLPATCRRLRDAGRSVLAALVAAFTAIAATAQIGRLFASTDPAKETSMSDVAERVLTSESAQETATELLRARELVFARPSIFDASAGDIAIAGAFGFVATVSLMWIVRQLLRPSVLTDLGAVESVRPIAPVEPGPAAGSNVERLISIVTFVSLAPFVFLTCYVFFDWSAPVSVGVTVASGLVRPLWIRVEDFLVTDTTPTESPRNDSGGFGR